MTNKSEKNYGIYGKMTKVLFKGSGFWIKYTELLYNGMSMKIEKIRAKRQKDAQDIQAHNMNGEYNFVD